MEKAPEVERVAEDPRPDVGTDRPLRMVAKFPVKPEEPVPWTSLEALEEFVAKVKNGLISPTSLVIFYMETEPDGAGRPSIWRQNVSDMEQIAIGAIITKMALFPDGDFTPR